MLALTATGIVRMLVAMVSPDGGAQLRSRELVVVSGVPLPTACDLFS